MILTIDKMRGSFLDQQTSAADEIRKIRRASALPKGRKKDERRLKKAGTHVCGKQIY